MCKAGADFKIIIIIKHGSCLLVLVSSWDALGVPEEHGCIKNYLFIQT